MALRLRLLGTMDLDGVELRRLGSRKARLLLARLALGRGRPVLAHELVDAIWSDGNAPARAGEQLSVLVSRVRAVIGAQRLTRAGGGYALRLDWLDVDAAAELVAEARRRLVGGGLAPARAAVDAALALDRGPLLDDEPDLPWLAAERAAAHRTVLEARLVAAEIAVATDDHWAAVGHAERILAAEPYHEVALRLLMTALARSGRPARALAVYAEFAARLREELGADPTPQTAALHLSLLQAGEAPALPAALAPRLAGRDLQLAMLAAAYSDATTGRVVRVRVSGEAGIGKTRLLEAFAATLPATAVVLRAAGSELGRRLPLQALLDALSEHLRRRDADAVAEILSGPAQLLGPFLGEVGAAGQPYGLAALTAFADSGAGQGLLLTALDTAFERLAPGRPLVLLVDDCHWIDAAAAAWLDRAPRRLARLPLLVVLASRVEEGMVVTADREIPLGPLDLTAVTRLVGAQRGAELFARSGGHPLFLIELCDAQPEELPASIRASVAERCDRAGPAGGTLRAAAVLGAEVDLELLAAVLEAPPAVLLDHLEEGVRRGLLTERPTGFAFRHQLIQESLRSDAGEGRRALLHRMAARSLAARADRSDPLLVAHHARAGGDIALAAQALAKAGDAAAARFDHDEALRHLSAAIELDDSPRLRVRRARAELPAGRFVEAAADAEAALAVTADAEALEVAGIAAYLLRDLPRCRRLAQEGARLAGDPAVGSSCLALAGRAAHAMGDLTAAQELLDRAQEIAPATTTAMVGIWRAPLLVDRGEPGLALETLADAAVVRMERHPFMLPHRHLNAAAAHAALGDVAAAFAALDAVDAAAAGQRTPRFTARAQNIRAFVLRNLGEAEDADRCNRAAYDVSLDQPGMGEPVADALLGLADGRLRAGDLEGAAEFLLTAERDAPRPRPFAWRHALRHQLLQARIALARDDLAAALAATQEVRRAAEALPLPRYVALARLLAVAAAPAAPRDLESELAAVDRFAALEAWWLLEEVVRRHELPGVREEAVRRRAVAAQRAAQCSLASTLMAPHPSAPAAAPV